MGFALSSYPQSVGHRTDRKSGTGWGDKRQPLKRNTTGGWLRRKWIFTRFHFLLPRPLLLLLLFLAPPKPKPTSCVSQIFQESGTLLPQCFFLHFARSFSPLRLHS